MKKTKKQIKNEKKTNLTILTIIIAAIIIIAITSIGIYTYVSPETITLNSDSAIANDVPTTPEINTSEDLNEVEAIIDQISLDDETDLINLQNELDNF